MLCRFTRLYTILARNVEWVFRDPLSWTRFDLWSLMRCSRGSTTSPSHTCHLSSWVWFPFVSFLPGWHRGIEYARGPVTVTFERFRMVRTCSHRTIFCVARCTVFLEGARGCKRTGWGMYLVEEQQLQIYSHVNLARVWRRPRERFLQL